MKLDQEKALKHIQQVEEKAGEILTDRQEIIALDKRRNDDRVGMRAVQKAGSNKTWITVGPLLLKMPSKTAEELLAKGSHIIYYSFALIFLLNVQELILFFLLYCRSKGM